MTNPNLTLPRKIKSIAILMCLLMLAVPALGQDPVVDDANIGARLIEGLAKSVYLIELKGKKTGTVHTLGFVVDTVTHPVIRRDLLLGCNKVSVKSLSGSKYKNKGIHSDSEDHNLARITMRTDRRKKMASGLTTAVPQITDTVYLIQLSPESAWLCWEGIVTDDRRVPGFGRLYFVASDAPPSDQLQLVLNAEGQLVGWRGRQALEDADVAYVIPAGQLTALHRLSTRKSRLPSKMWIGSMVTYYQSDTDNSEGDSPKNWNKENEGLQSLHSDSMYVLGLNHLWEGRFNIARDLFTTLVLEQPSFGPGWFYKGICDETLRDMELAMSAYNNAVRHDEDFAKAFFAIARLSRSKGLWGSRHARMAATYDPGSAEALVINAYENLSAWNAHNAIEQCRRAQQIDPEVTGLYETLARAYLLNEDYDLALHAADSAVMVDSTSPLPYVVKAGAYDALKQFAKAVPQYLGALERLPERSAKICFRLGLAYGELKQYDEAALAYWDAIDTYPNYKQAHNNLSAIYRTQGHLQLALKACSKAIMIDPYYSQARFSKGLTHAMMYDEGAARAELEKLQDMKSEYADNLKKVIEETDFDSD